MCSWAAVGVVDQQPDKAGSGGRVRAVMGVRRTQSPAMGKKWGRGELCRALERVTRRFNVTRCWIRSQQPYSVEWGCIVLSFFSNDCHSLSTAVL